MPSKKKLLEEAIDDEGFLEGTMTTLARPARTEIVPNEPLKFDYDQIDERVREEVRFKAIRIKQASRRVTDDLRIIGQSLIDIKELVPHGQFEELCTQEFGIGERMRTNLMNVARRITEEQVHLFSDSGALYLLAAPGVSEETRSQLIAQAAEGGAPIDRKSAQGAIDEQKRKAPTNGSAPGNAPGSGGNARTTTTREYTYLPGQGTVTHIVTTVDAGTGEVEQTDPLEGHIAVLKAAIDTALWFAKQYGDQFNADRVVAGADSMIKRLEADL